PKMDVVYLATSVPRKCGIATFTKDLADSISDEVGGVPYRVTALSDLPNEYDYPPEVTFEIRKNEIRDYARAAEYLNGSSAQIVSLQHEFGIFGGEAGKYLGVLLSYLRKPVVTTCHTILKDPAKEYRESFERMIESSDRLVAMSPAGVEILRTVYGVPENKIVLIHHGVPDVPFVDSNFYKDQFGVEGRTVLLTFGLLSPNKGIETALDSLPAVVERHPDVIYVVLGATHPEVRRHSGEEYRLSLERKVRDLGLGNHVVFHNRYVDLQELIEYICACDIYLTPYLAKEQVTSGTLAYAMGSGKAIISTPYWYAEDMLSECRGILVDFGDTKGLSRALLNLIEDPATRNKMRKKAYEYGRLMVWREVGRRYVELFQEVLREREHREVREVWQARMFPQATLPDIKLDHLLALSDDVGLLQHAAFGIPDRDHGYSADDVGRGLALLMTYYNQVKDDTILPTVRTYMSFLKHAQTQTGHFHNFMSYDRRFLDQEGSDDTLGRVTWGLGTVVKWGPNQRLRHLAQNMMEKGLPQLERMESPRGKAYAILGFHHLLQRFAGASRFRWLLEKFADDLAAHYTAHRTADWHWFEDILTYGNAKLPEALFRAHQDSGKQAFLDVAIEALDFLTATQWNGVYFELIGNEGWYPKDGEKATFGQQPVDAGYLVEAYIAAYQVTGRDEYLVLAQYAFEWFLGRNRLNEALYDFADGAVADGIDSSGISANQGAESVICFLMALIGMSEFRSQRLSASQPERPEITTTLGLTKYATAR
ncbi:MAG: glycosyltransferase, partial [Desulfomonile sp.]|nr:glycosyltransferase [Desulfomonile sp.]